MQVTEILKELTKHFYEVEYYMNVEHYWNGDGCNPLEVKTIIKKVEWYYEEDELKELYDQGLSSLYNRVISDLDIQPDENSN